MAWNSWNQKSFYTKNKKKKHILFMLFLFSVFSFTRRRLFFHFYLGLKEAAAAVVGLHKWLYFMLFISHVYVWITVNSFLTKAVVKQRRRKPDFFIWITKQKAWAHKTKWNYKKKDFKNNKLCNIHFFFVLERICSYCSCVQFVRYLILAFGLFGLNFRQIIF